MALQIAHLCLKIQLLSSVCAITLPERHVMTDYAWLSCAERVQFTPSVTSFSYSFYELQIYWSRLCSQLESNKGAVRDTHCAFPHYMCFFSNANTHLNPDWFIRWLIKKLKGMPSTNTHIYYAMLHMCFTDEFTPGLMLRHRLGSSLLQLEDSVYTRCVWWRSGL